MASNGGSTRASGLTSMTEKEFRRKIPFLTVAAVALVLLGACWWLIFSRLATRTEQHKEQLQHEVADLRSVESRLIQIEQVNDVISEKARSVADVVAMRPQWIEVLNAVQSCMLDGMWLVSLATSDTGPGGRRMVTEQQQQGHIPAHKKDVDVHFLELRGMIFSDKAIDTSIQSFRDQLRNSKFFDETTDISSAPLPNPGDVVREFTILLVLKNPLP